MRIKSLLLVLLAVIATKANAEVNVFACEPEWAALAEQIGAEHVNVYSATSAYQDPHYIQARPSLLAKIRRTDLLLCSGSELEIGWLPLLLRKAGNANIQVGKPGYFMASEYIADKLEVPLTIDRSMGDIHAGGNPHVHLNPNHLLTVAGLLQQRLSQLDSDNAASYQANYQEFSERWQAAVEQWQQQAQSLKGKKAIVYHKSFSYLLDWLGVEAIADLEPKPGIPPGSKHLAEVLSLQKTQRANWVIYAPYQSDKPVNWLRDKTGIAVLNLPYTVGGSDQAKDLFSLYQQQIDLLLGALNES